MATIVFKPSDNIKDKMVKYYEDKQTSKKPDYSLLQANEGGTVITIYESGKVMFQGLSADVDYALWRDLEMSFNKRDVDSEIALEQAKKDKKKEMDKDYRFLDKSTIGSDEVGTGDYFGPIIVTASYVSKDNIAFLHDLGVRDSKKITDEKILEIAPKVMERIPHETYIMSNIEYNNLKDHNMNRIKAVLHNKMLYSLINNNSFDYSYVVVDQFALPPVYYSYLKTIDKKVTKITFATHAEDKCLSVAASSIICRYLFLKEMDKLSKMMNMTILKGASNKVDTLGVDIVKRYGFDKLKEIAKLNFKNTDKIKEALK